jgi:hypothetical protein
MPARLVACLSVLAALGSTAAFATSNQENAEPATVPECLDRFSHASGDGKPLLDRRPARPESATAWYAVDRRDNGCPVLVKMGNPREVVPVPRSPERIIAFPGAERSR